LTKIGPRSSSARRSRTPRGSSSRRPKVTTRTSRCSHGLFRLDRTISSSPKRNTVRTIRASLNRRVTERSSARQFDPLGQPLDVVAQPGHVGGERGHLGARDEHRVLGGQVIGRLHRQPVAGLARTGQRRAQQRHDAHRRGVADEARQFLLRFRPQLLQHAGQRLRELGVALEPHVAQRGLRLEQQARQRGRIDADGDRRLAGLGAETAAGGDAELDREGRRLQARAAPGERGQHGARPRLARQHVVQHRRRGVGGDLVEHVSGRGFVVPVRAESAERLSDCGRTPPSACRPLQSPSRNFSRNSTRA
jgi:hypothetical protein